MRKVIDNPLTPTLLHINIPSDTLSPRPPITPTPSHPNPLSHQPSHSYLATTNSSSEVRKVFDHPHMNIPSDTLSYQQLPPHPHPLSPQPPSHSYLAAANASSEVRKVFDNWLNKAIHRLREWSQAALAGMRSALEVARLQVH